MMKNSDLLLGYSLDDWTYYNEKTPIITDISRTSNSHILICGMSGSGKSYFEAQLFARFVKNEPNGEFFFADYKGEDAFTHLQCCSKYFQYNRTLDCLDIVYQRFSARKSGKDKTRSHITLIWDEYIANILALLGEDKKLAEKVMRQVGEILMIGRTLSVRIIVSCQRPDAVAFPVGSRLNYGIIVVLGAFNRTVYEMLMPDFMDRIKNREFGRGEGSLLLQGSQLHFIKVPQVKEIKSMNDFCVSALL